MVLNLNFEGLSTVTQNANSTLIYTLYSYHTRTNQPYSKSTITLFEMYKYMYMVTVMNKLNLQIMSNINIKCSVYYG